MNIKEFNNIKKHISYLYENTPDEIEGLSFGKKITNNVVTDNNAIIFYVTKKLPENKLINKYIVPKEIIINNKKYLTDVVNKIDCKIITECVIPDNSNVPNRARIRPIKGGCTIAPFSKSWVGTMGAVVVDNDTGGLVGLTNAHVAIGPGEEAFIPNGPYTNTSEGFFSTLRPVVRMAQGNESQNYAGIFVTGLSDFNFINGLVTKYTPFTSKFSNSGPCQVDAATFALREFTPNVGPSVGTPYEVFYRIMNFSESFKQLGLNINTPLDFATTEEINRCFTEDLDLYSSGRTTGPKGEVCKLHATELFATITVSFQTRSQLFDDVVIFENRNNNLPAILPGDSGSTIIANFNGVFKIVGLAFAGGLIPVEGVQGALKYVGVFCRIDNVRRFLNISPWDGSPKRLLNDNYPNPYNLNPNSEDLDSLKFDFQKKGFVQWLSEQPKNALGGLIKQLDLNIKLGQHWLAGFGTWFDWNSITPRINDKLPEIPFPDISGALFPPQIKNFPNYNFGFDTTRKNRFDAYDLGYHKPPEPTVRRPLFGNRCFTNGFVIYGDPGEELGKSMSATMDHGYVMPYNNVPRTGFFLAVTSPLKLYTCDNTGWYFPARATGFGIDTGIQYFFPLKSTRFQNWRKIGPTIPGAQHVMLSRNFGYVMRGLIDNPGRMAVSFGNENQSYAQVYQLNNTYDDFTLVTGTNGPSSFGLKKPDLFSISADGKIITYIDQNNFLKSFRWQGNSWVEDGGPGFCIGTEVTSLAVDESGHEAVVGVPFVPNSISNYARFVRNIGGAITLTRRRGTYQFGLGLNNPIIENWRYSPWDFVKRVNSKLDAPAFKTWITYPSKQRPNLVTEPSPALAQINGNKVGLLQSKSFFSLRGNGYFDLRIEDQSISRVFEYDNNGNFVRSYFARAFPNVGNRSHHIIHQNSIGRYTNAETSKIVGWAISGVSYEYLGNNVFYVDRTIKNPYGANFGDGRVEMYNYFLSRFPLITVIQNPNKKGYGFGTSILQAYNSNMLCIGDPLLENSSDVRTGAVYVYWRNCRAPLFDGIMSDCCAGLPIVGDGEAELNLSCEEFPYIPCDEEEDSSSSSSTSPPPPITPPSSSSSLPWEPPPVFPPIPPPPPPFTPPPPRTPPPPSPPSPPPVPPTEPPSTPPPRPSPTPPPVPPPPTPPPVPPPVPPPRPPTVFVSLEDLPLGEDILNDIL